MADYEAHLNSLPDKLYKDSVYYFSKDRLANVYQGFFAFGLNDLGRDDRWKEWDVARCGLFFRKEAKNDAKAVKWDNDLWIEVNDYLIKNLFERFEDFKLYLNSLPEAHLFKNSHPNDELYFFMFTTTTVFLYYHELGHIIQYDKSSQKQITEEMNAALTKIDFDIMKHACEYDSDEFAANFLYEQIAGNFITKSKLKSRQVLKAMITTSIAAIFVLFEMLDDGFQLPVYFEEKSHPNSLIRTIAITGLVLNKMEEEFGTKYEITQSDVIKRAFQIVVPLLGSGYSMKNFYDALNLEKKGIVNYSTKLRKIRDQFDWMAGVKLKKRSLNATNK
ncbi:hypothetical protein [Dyadobacter sp. CY351]|uniref:hypothetical protein n=1 Tax=Dyadobacter sp. CY351 TaxID=2909337 RepID=UPI001F334C85|nr:hypothetical protein [Dyadobacter sp. CY351]MCF2518745.1 hypothetical protein [Dyadobacter sp. CY351]